MTARASLDALGRLCHSPSWWSRAELALAVFEQHPGTQKGQTNSPQQCHDVFAGYSPVIWAQWERSVVATVEYDRLCIRIWRAAS